MRIALYGLPTAGKTFILNKVKGLNVMAGSALLKEIAPDFQTLSKSEKDKVRNDLAIKLKKQDNFIMDGHYAFGDEIVFTENDGCLYDVMMYLYASPTIIKERMLRSDRNVKYLDYDIDKWQKFEIESLRNYCHEHNKDFYVIDNPNYGYFKNPDIVLQFINSVVGGFSCVSYAQVCTENIVSKFNGDSNTLIDGDKTLIIEDSCALVGYKTNNFDGNFYTGFQSWRHWYEFNKYLTYKGDMDECIKRIKWNYNPKIINKIHRPCAILSSGYSHVWNIISSELDMPYFGGSQMSSETKFYIVKNLQERNIHVTAYGDSMNDFYMLKQADIGCLVLREDGSYSRSLRDRDMEGILFV